MITDEQVIAAIAEFYKSGTGNGGMRKALEAYEQSKWVKFDVNDESTYPPLDQVVMCKPFNEPVLQMFLIQDSHPQFDGFFFEDERGFFKDIKCIAYWQRLPDYQNLRSES